MRLWLGTCAAMLAAVAATAAFGVSGSGAISTFAGTDRFPDGGFSGDGGPAVRARLDNPWDVAVDAKGNVYIADYRNRRVRKVSPSGKISTFAGGGAFGSIGTGDEGPATAAYLMGPKSIAIDSEGNVYIGGDDFLVRKVSRNGTITTVAGARNANGSLGDGGPATAAQLLGATMVAVDRQGNLYITDEHRVRKVDKSGTITTIAGSRTLGFSGDGGPATRAKLKQPSGIVVDQKGNVYIADTANQRVRKVSRRGTITTFAGTGKYGVSGDGGPAVRARLSDPTGLAVDRKGNVYIADSSMRVRKVDLRGRITTIAGRGTAGMSGDGGPATRAQLYFPKGIEVDAKGNVYIADTGNSRVRKVRP